MDFLKLKEEICIICLEYDVNCNWNEIIKSCGISYKDCYYKYTQLDEIDPDFCPQNLCEQCANELISAHLLFAKALESHYVFQNTAKYKKLEIKNSYKDTVFDTQDIVQSCTSKDNFTKCIKYEIEPYPEVLGDKVEYTKDFIEEISLNDDVKLLDNPLQEQLVGLYDIKPSKFLVEMHTGSKANDMKSQRINLLKSTEGNSIVKTSRVSLKKRSLKVQQNKSRIRKSITRKIVQRAQDYSRRSPIKKSLNNTESQKLSSKIFFNVVLTKKPLTDCDTSSPINFTSKDSKSCNLQKPSITKNDKTNENSKNSITHVIVKKEEPKKQIDNSLLEINLDESECCLTSPSTIKSNEAGELQKYSETKENNDEALANEISENSLEEINSNFEERNSKKCSRRKPNYLCQYCSFKTPGIGHLRRHEETHLDNRERNIVCSKCGIKFYTKLALRCHMQTHDENRTKKHKCEFCEKAFFNKGALNVHRRIHLGLMFKCQICQKEYYRQLDLDRHLIKHSVVPERKNIEKKKYVVECQYCKKSVLTNNIKEHMAIHSNQPQAKCKICEKDFFTRSRCTSHLRRFHKVDSSDYANFLHSYVKSDARASFLKIRQERQVQLVTK